MPRSQSWSQREHRYAPDRPTAKRVLATIAARLPSLVYDPGATINLIVTTYLDTPDHQFLTLADASDGQQSLRVRIREYLSSPGTGAPYRFGPTCFFERKERRHDLRHKQRVEVDKSLIAGILLHRRIPELSAEATAISGELTNRELAPVLVSAYERRVFGYETGLRVTYDERLSYHFPPEQLYQGAPALLPSVLGRPAATGPSRILEVKYPTTGAMPSWLQILLSGLPEEASFSKFRDGMHALDESDGPVHLTSPINLADLE